MKQLVLIVAAFIQISNLYSTNSFSYKDSIDYRYLISVELSGFLKGDSFWEYYNIRCGRFVKNDLAVGLEYGRRFYGLWERTTQIGAFAKYYFYSIKSFRAFLDGSYLYGDMNYNNLQTLSSWDGYSHSLRLNFGVGYTNLFLQHMSVSLFMGYNFDYITIRNHPTLGVFILNEHDLSYGFQIVYRFKIKNNEKVSIQ